VPLCRMLHAFLCLWFFFTMSPCACLVCWAESPPDPLLPVFNLLTIRFFLYGPVAYGALLLHAVHRASASVSVHDACAAAKLLSANLYDAACCMHIYPYPQPLLPALTHLPTLESRGLQAELQESGSCQEPKPKRSTVPEQPARRLVP
jgi:hypothetical protein